MVTLETERLSLRPWQRADRDAFAAINADPAVMEHMPGPMNRAASDALADRIEAHFAAHGFGLWAVSVRGGAEFCGFTGLPVRTFPAHFTPCIEVAWRLAADHWGRGYATEAAVAAMRYGTEELQLREIVSYTVPANRRSWRVMEKIGLRRDPDGDFEHPKLPRGHPLAHHWLYRPPNQALART